MSKVWIYILIMAGVSLLLRALPMTLLRKPIKNRFIRSLLFYTPYVTLAVMTVPAMFHVTANPLCGVLGFLATTLAAWLTKNLFISAVVACAVVFLSSLPAVVVYLDQAMAWFSSIL